MTDPEFAWGDTVEVQSLTDPTEWRIGSVCALPPPAYTVEYVDGSDEQVVANRLRPTVEPVAD